jgi:hypothetical protein
MQGPDDVERDIELFAGQPRVHILEVIGISGTGTPAE